MKYVPTKLEHNERQKRGEQSEIYPAQQWLAKGARTKRNANSMTMTGKRDANKEKCGKIRVSIRGLFNKDTDAIVDDGSKNGVSLLN
jgi:hypothetical protein